ncbi:hypothetical protein A2U01_0018969, partial [Trifolium medium]|nr:hypothetical protein [Trifolium medium]
PNKGGGGQSSVPPKAALPVPPRYVEGYTYPQTAALYAAPPYTYPQTAASYAASHYNSVPPGPSTYQTHGYGQGPYPEHYNQNQ